MCYSKKLSLTSFTVGLVSSISLIIYGNPEYYNQNLVIGLFGIFISLMQLVEYLMWSDLLCNKGKNKFASMLGPLLNLSQPVVLLLLMTIFLNNTRKEPNTFIYILNGLYLLIILYKYVKFIQNKDNLCTGLSKEKHLDWKWKNDFFYFFYIFYHVVIIYNCISFIEHKRILAAIVMMYVILGINMTRFKNNLGELWCFFGTGTPLILLALDKLNII